MLSSIPIPPNLVGSQVGWLGEIIMCEISHAETENTSV